VTGPPPHAIEEIAPFQVDVAPEILADLGKRLTLARWPGIEGPSGRMGIDRGFMQRMVEYWRTRFDWGERQRSLNRAHHYRALIDGRAIHFVHERGVGPAPLPLLITHGWPGSFVEMLEIIPLLTDPGSHGGDPADAFDVVVPSLPGFAFSDDLPGRLDVARISDLWDALMVALGYPAFGAQGGDWGASISTQLGLRHPDSVLGIHLNYIPGAYTPFFGQGARPPSPEEDRFLSERQRWFTTHGAYAHAQATRPLTLAYGLSDSPIGLAAWIIEKFREWSDCGGDVERAFTLDALLTNVIIYWATGTAGSSMRLYAESPPELLHFGPGERVPAPCAVTRCPFEAPFPPRELVERCYDVRQWTELPRGGHFAAMEEPALLADDIRRFFRSVRRGR